MTETYNLWARLYLGDELQYLLILDANLVWQDVVKSPRTMPLWWAEWESLEAMAKLFRAVVFTQVAKRLKADVNRVVVFTYVGRPAHGEIVLNKIDLYPERWD